jgi:hypothetical protein
MISTLKFDLPDEESQHRQAMDGAKWEAVVWNLTQAIRNQLKYGPVPKSAEDALEKIRESIQIDMENEGLRFSP